MSPRPLRVGSIVIAKAHTGVCHPGEPGVCYEQYTLGGRPGWGVIFARGAYDGFSPDEVALALIDTGEVDEAIAGYQFRNVLQLARDFDRGLFAPAFAAAAVMVDR